MSSSETTESTESSSALKSARGIEVDRAFEVLRQVSITQKRAKVQREKNHLAEMIERAFGGKP